MLYNSIENSGYMESYKFAWDRLIFKMFEIVFNLEFYFWRNAIDKIVNTFIIIIIIVVKT
jgi:hypothetical protein